MAFPTETFIKFAKAQQVPSYIKTSTTRSFDEVDNPKSKAAVYFAKFAALAGQPTISQSEIASRAQIFNISEDIADLAHKYAEFVESTKIKTAAPTEKYPLRNRAEVEAAIGWLNKNAYAISVEDRRELAQRIQEKVAEYSISADERLAKFAGTGIVYVSHIIPNLLKRASLIRISKSNQAPLREKTANELVELAGSLQKSVKEMIDSEGLNKIATILQFVDNEYGLHGHYSNGYIDKPDDAIYQGKVKEALAKVKYACELADGRLYDLRDFEQLKLADIMDTFGADFVEAMTDGLALSHEKIAETIEVMTDLEKVVFTDMVKAAGITGKAPKYETVDLKKLTEEMKTVA